MKIMKMMKNRKPDSRKDNKKPGADVKPDAETKPRLKRNKLIKWISGIVIVVIFVLAIAVKSCGGYKLEKGIAIQAGEQKVPEELVYFYARYLQSEVVKVLGDQYDNKVWDEKLSKTKLTYGEDLKGSTISDVEDLYVIQERAKKQKVSLSKKEKKKVSDAAKEFIKNNSEENLKKMYASEKTVKKFLELLLLEQKMYPYVVEGINVAVSDNEAKQHKYSYVFFGYQTGEKKELKKQAKELLNKVKETGDLEASAKEMGKEVESQTYGDEIALHPSLKEELSKLEDGQMGKLVTTKVGYYVVRMDAVMDKKATKAKKKEIAGQKKNAAYQKRVDRWKNSTVIHEDKDMWKGFSYAYPEKVNLESIHTFFGSEPVKTETK